MISEALDIGKPPQVSRKCKRGYHYRSCNQQHQVRLTPGNPTPTRLLADSMALKRACRKFNFITSFHQTNLMTILLLIIITMLETMYSPAHSFSSFTTIREAKRNGCVQHHFRNRGRGNIFVDSPLLLFSESRVMGQEEALISLEWTEYFSPTEGNVDAEQQQQTPVLFLHGLLGSKRNFATCANMLAVQLDKKRRIMGVDLRNHGDTQPWSNKMSYPSMAQDVVNFLESQRIKKVILVGHSMGGKVAQALALLYPEYVEGLVVLDIAPVTYSREEDPHWRAVEDILRAIHRVIEESESTGANSTKRDIDLSLRKSIPDPALRAFVLTNFDSRKNEWKIPIATMVEELEQIAGFDLTSATTQDPTSSSTYEGDVFIINGGQSRFVRHAYMDKIASYFPNHMLTTIRGSGHWVHAEAPDDLVALLKRYLDR